MKRITRIILAITFCLIAFPNATYAKKKSSSANNFYFNEFVADYYLEKASDGTGKMHVREKLVAVFPYSDQNHGIERYIPYTNQNGKNLTIDSRDDLHLKVSRNGSSEPFTISTDSGAFKVRIGDADTYVHGTQTYVLEYDFTHVITAFDSAEHSSTPFQELYWDTNGTGWEQTFGSVTANLHMSDEVLEHVKPNAQWCYTGAQGENTGRCSFAETVDGFSWSFKYVDKGENLTFVVDFDPNTFKIPDPKYNYLGYAIAAIEIGIVALSFLAFNSYRKKRLEKIEYSKRSIMPEYAPHKDHTVAEMATVYTNTTKQSMVATVLDLTVRKKISIVKGKKSTFGGQKWNIVVNDLKDLKSWEIDVLHIIAGSDPKEGSTYEMKTSYSSKKAILAQDYNESTIEALSNAGFLEKNKSGKVKKFISHDTDKKSAIFAYIFFMPLALTAGIGIPFIVKEILAAITNQEFTLDKGLLEMVIVSAISTIILVIIVARTSKIKTISDRTIAGLELSQYMEGLKLYIKMAEADRLKFLQSVDGAETSNEGIVKLYEKVLPYAALFGLEKSWMAELAKYYELEDVTAPDWYTAGVTVSTFNSVSSSIRSSTVSSSGSSGGGGGGFSGGGGGGGGGGGW